MKRLVAKKEFRNFPGRIMVGDVLEVEDKRADIFLQNFSRLWAEEEAAPEEPVKKRAGGKSRPMAQDRMAEPSETS